MNIQNNKTTDVTVCIQSFTKEGNSGELEIVYPKSVDNWNELSTEESMSKMSLGIYNKDGFSVTEELPLTEDNPLWLETDMNEVEIGVLNRAESLTTPYVSKLSFVSKHGKNFIGGSSKGKFNLIFKFK